MASYPNATYVKDTVTATLLRMMETQDYSSITISELVKESKVSRSSFYRNFSDKDAVIRNHLNRLMDDWKKSFSNAPGQDLSDSLLRYFYSHREFYLLLYRSGLSWMLYENIKTACGVCTDSPAILAYGAASIAGALFGWADEWISRGMKETPDELKQLAQKHRASSQSFSQV